MQWTRFAFGWTTLGLGLFLASGCKWLPNLDRDNKDLINPPAFYSGKATPESLVNYMNENARLMSSLRAKLDMDVTQGGKSVGPTGMLACQKPRDFRMRAQVLGSQEVDIGSNSEELWFWIKRATPPHQYICSHADLAAGKAKLPFPFDPSMVLSALGMAEFDPTLKYDLKTYETSLELSWHATSAEGLPVTRLLAFHRKPVTGDRSQVIGHLVKDGKTGKLICKAMIEKVYRDRSGAIVPSNVVIEYPAEQATIRLMLKDIEVNRINEADSRLLFSRSPIPGAQVYDLAKGALVSPDGGAGSAGYFPR
jgi:hypothetical protein